EEKMSKSLGNVILAEHFAQKYDPNALRYLILNSHYNQVINLSEELIRQAMDYLQKIRNLLKKLNFYLYTEKIKFAEQKPLKRKEIVNSLLNNLNTVKVLFFLEQSINSLNKSIDKKENDNQELVETISNFHFMLDWLGFKFNLAPYNSEVKLLIKTWQELRKRGDYQLADKVRKKLQEMDII
ncbi:2566_t:CDS:1, partial [Funneliformis geosporum]